MHLQGYELLEMTVEDGIQVFKVREQVSGGLFQIHVFHAGMAEAFDRLTRELPDIPPQVSRVVKISKERGSGYILTELLPENVGIQAWIKRLQDAERPAAPNPSLSRESVDNLRKLEMKPGALQPIVPGPDDHSPSMAETADSDSNSMSVYLRAKRLKEDRQRVAASDRCDARPVPATAERVQVIPPVAPASAPAEVQRPAGRDPAAPKGESGSHTPGELTELLKIRRQAKGNANRQQSGPVSASHGLSRDDATGPAPSLHAPEPPPTPASSEGGSMNGPVPIEPDPVAPAKTDPGLGTWLTIKEKAGPGSAPAGRAVFKPEPAPKESYAPPPAVPPEPELELPIPPVARLRRIDQRPTPAAIPPASSPRVSRPAYPAPEPSKSPGAQVAMPPPSKLKDPEEASGLRTDWRFIVWTMCGVMGAVAAVLWVVER
jgi:hypothetical protein